MTLTAGEVRLLLPTLLPQRATVYGYTSGSGTFATVLASDLRCRVQHVSGGQTQGQRAELFALRSILFDPAYAMPEDAIVEVEGVRYDPIEGTFRHLKDGASVVRVVDAVVVRDET